MSGAHPLAERKWPILGPAPAPVNESGEPYNALMMSSRSFRDRYANLARLTGADPKPAELRDEWPLPPGGRVQPSALGEYVVVERTTATNDVRESADLLEQVLRLPLETLLFLDTETTGLAGGTGTYAFLVGIGYFESPGRFTVRQYFMRHPGDEIGMLHGLERELAGRNTAVTFNGKTFDLPLLITRFRMHHREPPTPADHFDVLAPARAIWKHRLPDCTLGTLERSIFNVRREVDAPGWMIPQIYSAYLRTRDIVDLAPVFEHNNEDIVTLARLAALVLGYQHGAIDPLDQTDRVAVTLHRLRQRPDAAVIERALEDWSGSLVPATLRFRLLAEVSQILKRQADFDLLVPTWKRALTDPGRAIRMFAAEELAKYYEHQCGDPHSALDIARPALENARLMRDRAATERLVHRVSRLERKARRLP